MTKHALVQGEEQVPEEEAGSSMLNLLDIIPQAGAGQSRLSLRFHAGANASFDGICEETPAGSGELAGRVLRVDLKLKPLPGR